MKNRQIGIIGHFGGNKELFDGQTIKTKILCEELTKETNWKIKKVDTFYKNKRPIKLFLRSLMTLISTKDIIVLLSGNGMKLYFPVLYFFSKCFKTRIYHDVIGGNLDTYVKKYPSFKKFLNSFAVNWVETEQLKNKLEICGIQNCIVIPNFKRLELATVEKNAVVEPFKFCTFSRVMEEKGIETAINAIQSINKKYGREICKLDIYGSVDEGYKKKFNQLIVNATGSVNYKGMVSYNKSVEAIKDYYALLFPTFWHGEGFPGTIVDAFFAGLPVIATDWNSNGELIRNKKNGILYPNEEMRDLTEAIEWLIKESEDKYYKMKVNCVKTANDYQPDKYIKLIVSQIEEG